MAAFFGPYRVIHWKRTDGADHEIAIGNTTAPVTPVYHSNPGKLHPRYWPRHIPLGNHSLPLRWKKESTDD